MFLGPFPLSSGVPGAGFQGRGSRGGVPGAGFQGRGSRGGVSAVPRHAASRRRDQARDMGPRKGQID